MRSRCEGVIIGLWRDGMGKNGGYLLYFNSAHNKDKSIVDTRFNTRL